jgi:hypothetical protein
MKTYQIKLIRNDGSIKTTWWCYKELGETMKEFINRQIKEVKKEKGENWVIESIERIM